MFFIVFYHMLFFFVADFDQNVLYKALYIPLHVAVLCFVLISGYFHIKPSVKGFVKLFAPLILFYCPLAIYEFIRGDGDAKSLLFFSHSPYWFIRTYFYLFLISPLLNVYLSSNKKRIYTILVLGFIAVYMGTMQEKSLYDGKNLPFFMFMYALGDYLKQSERKINVINSFIIFIVWLFFNCALIYTIIHYEGTIVCNVVWLLSYPYCSPLLIINAVLFFLMFSRLDFSSTFVNSVAGSVFTVYILHHQHFIMEAVIRPIVDYFYSLNNTPGVFLLYIALLTIIVMIVSIILDKLFTPLMRLMTSYTTYLYSKIVGNSNRSL